MDIKKLLLGIRGCKCGRDHICPIETVEISENASAALAKCAEAYKRILIVYDENTYCAASASVESALVGHSPERLIYKRSSVLVPDERAIEELESALPEEADLIVGVGSGVINDLCKYVSFLRGIPYFIYATAPSMDGYASVGAALILGGMKVTKNAHVPTAIFADPRVLTNAPIDMIRAGFGDIIGKYSCLSDWRLAAVVLDEYICERVVSLTYDAVEETVKLADGIVKRNPSSVAALMESLVSVGILMAYVGNSRPASGSEHHYSHYFEIVGIIRGEEYLPHGIDVCCSAIECAALRDKILSVDDIGACKPRHNEKLWNEEIERIYGKVAPEVKALQAKLGWYSQDRLPLYRERWDKIKEILSSTPSRDKMEALVAKIGLSYKSFCELYGETKLHDASLYAKDLKDRYTVLWLYYDLFV